VRSRPVALVLATLAALALPGMPGTAEAAPVPGSGCALFPRGNMWNTRVDGLPVHAKSDTWLASMHADSTDLHPDFGPPDYGLPFDVVARAHAKVAVDFLYAAESDPGPYPFDADTLIEGGSDRHALIVEEGSCVLYELYAAEWNDGDPQAGSGAIWDLGSNRLRPEGWTSADAAGLPIPMITRLRIPMIAIGILVAVRRIVADLLRPRRRLAQHQDAHRDNPRGQGASRHPLCPHLVLLSLSQTRTP
jgi:hypothetical protein